MLAAILGNSIWVWVALGVHVYAVIWIVGVLVSFRTLPHVVTADRLTLRDSIFHEIELPLAAIESVHSMREEVDSRSGYQLDEASRTVVMAHGTANLRVVLNDLLTDVKALEVTADDPDGFRAAIERVTSPGTSEPIL